MKVWARRGELPTQPGVVHVSWELLLYGYTLGEKYPTWVRDLWAIHAADWTHDRRFVGMEPPYWPWKPTTRP